jgi:hypothetical protein
MPRQFSGLESVSRPSTLRKLLAGFVQIVTLCDSLSFDETVFAYAPLLSARRKK